MAFEGTVVVAGATGRCGSMVVKSLVAQGIPARAMARNADKAKPLEGPGVEIVPGDLSDPKQIEDALQGCAALVISIGAGPQRSMGADGKPTFSYEGNQTPAHVDYAAQVLLVEAAKRAGVKQVVQISSLSVTNSNHFLNQMGGGRTLDWKLRAEDHLRASGLTYTVVRPGGLEQAKVEDGALEFGQGDTLQGSVNRKHVAEVCVQALLCESARNTTFELIAKEGPAPADYCALFAALTPA